MRDRLVELINEAKDKYPTIPSVNCCKPTFTHYLADYLIKNGAIVPPCKVWDTVYSPRENSILEQNVISIEIEKDSHVRVYFTCDYLCDGCPHEQTYQNQAGDGGCFGECGESLFAFEDFGKTVFLTREEAEQALRGEHHAEIH